MNSIWTDTVMLQKRNPLKGDLDKMSRACRDPYGVYAWEKRDRCGYS